MKELSTRRASAGFGGRIGRARVYSTLLRRSIFRMPEGGLPRVKWFYFAFAEGSMLSCVLAVVAGDGLGADRKAIGLAALGLLMSVRMCEFRRGRLLPAWTEVPQAVVVAVAALAAGPLGAGVGLFFTGCFFRAVYGSSLRTVIITIGNVGLLGLCAFMTLTPDWQHAFIGQAFGLAVATLLTRLLLVILLRQNLDLANKERLLVSVFDALDVSVIVDGGSDGAALMNRAARTLSEELELPDLPGAWSGSAAMYAGDGTTRLSPDQMPVARARSGQHVRDMELVIGHADAARRHFSVNAAPIADFDTSAGAVVTLREVTDQHLAQAELVHLVSHDELTGLGNRNLLSTAITDCLQRLKTGADGFAVILLDIDNFKHVNESLGHAFGDQVLQVIAERLRGSLRPEDVIARLGGDEFAVVVSDPHVIARIPQRICDLINEPVDLPRSCVTISASVGVVAVDATQTTEGVLAAADLAMYAAKAAGGNQVKDYHPGLLDALEYRLTLEEDLRGALRKGEFEVHYQPYINLDTGTSPGAEALVRWRHPLRGLILPQQFIPITESTGMIVEIGRWILRSACLAAAEWQPADPGQIFSVSVNVSARQLDDPRFVDDVVAALAMSGLPASALILEITESALVQDSPLITERLHRLKELGLRIAVDDFGTGYSSLSRLGTFPLDVLKIDISFVRNIETGHGGALVSAIVAVAAALYLDVVAEGVETEAQATALAARGCRILQGYYFAKPLPAPSFGPPVLLRTTCLRPDLGTTQETTGSPGSAGSATGDPDGSAPVQLRAAPYRR